MICIVSTHTRKLANYHSVLVIDFIIISLDAPVADAAVLANRDVADHVLILLILMMFFKFI